MWNDKHEQYVKEGFLTRDISPCGRLVLYNYTDKTTYEKNWDEVTIISRGSVYELSSGKMIAHAFPKFFNFSELPKEQQEDVLKSSSFEAFEKVDGSLGVIYRYDNEWMVNTRGSFSSEQAIRAKEMLAEYSLSLVPFGTTLLCEIVYPENKIIVDYGGKKELVLLAAFHEGKELPAMEVSAMTGLRSALYYSFGCISEVIELQKILDHNNEGFVVRLSDGTRVKFKTDKYMELARILAHNSPIVLWENMKDGTVDRDFMAKIPEEFRDEFELMAKKLETKYGEVYRSAGIEFYDAMTAIRYYAGLPLDGFRKELGLYLEKEAPRYSRFIFPWFLGKKEVVNKLVMEEIYPKGNVL